MALSLSWRGALVLACMLVSGSAFAAQVPYSFEQLLGVLKPGDIVIVSDANGNETFGRVVDLTAERLGVGTGSHESGTSLTTFAVVADRVFTTGQVAHIRRADFTGRAESRIFERPTRPFRDASQVLKTGDRVTVTASDGTKTTGTIAEIGAAQLSVRAGTVRSFSEADVAAIEQRTRDRLWNGTGIGAGLGALAGVLWIGSLYAPNASDAVAPIMLLSIGVGAGIGALVDSGVGGDRTPVYVRPATVSRSATVTPIVGRKGVGLAYAMRW